MRTRAAALNRADLLVLAGHQHGAVGGAAIVGLECAGEVESLGAGRDRFRRRRPRPVFGAPCAGRIRRHRRRPRHENPGERQRSFFGSDDAASSRFRRCTMRSSPPAAEKATSFLIQGASSGVGLMAMMIARKWAPAS